MRDVVTFQKLRGQNHYGENIAQLELTYKKRYIFDYYLQINLSAFDGSNYLNIE